MSQATLGSAPYQNSNLFSGYYLNERIYDLEGWDCDEEAEAVFDNLKTLWELEGGLVDSYKEDELLDEWIDEVLDILGFGTKSEATLPNSGGYNDRLLFDSPEQRRDAAERVSGGETDADYKLASAVLEAKQWGADFTERFSEARSYRDASHQIKYYLEHTPETLNWGILTDGRKWRLYGTKDYATEIYYEVDLPELLSTGTLEQFKYFYAFFRPQAFRETAGTSFLDTVWNESETAAQELGEDLQDNVFTALRVLGEGFIHQNDLDIDPDDEAAREELKEQSLVLLYRLMFVLYAESRGLIRPDNEAARDEYEKHFSLDQLRAEIHEAIQEGDTYEDYSGYSTKMWSQLQNLFELVDEGNDDLDIPPYNGGLFDNDEHEFLAENEVADRHLAEVIHRLGTTEGDDGDPVLADYADLDTRHLGSIYEGLLEHEFRIADEQYAAVSEDGGQVWKPASKVSVADAVETVEAGELYVVNDDGERKATGAYYTPDYVVSYIVEETIDPLLDDIKADLEADGLEPSDQAYFGRFYRRIQELKILDPAMGSAHFLTSATAYLTEQVMEVVREHEKQGRDEQDIRRTIAKECIYGVDVNGMAVELGKLSMWLETLAADQPLAFLDHHLKDGNSLVGSDITEVLSDDVDNEGGQLTLMQAAARARKNTLEHVMELMQDLLAIDNETLDDIKSMEELYDEIRDDPLYQRLFEITNVHTAEEFGLDVPEGVYEEMAGAIEDADEWAEIQDEDWFASAQAIADEEDFFHWELEFPEVFFGEDGEKKADAGFDAVVGNPPYVRIHRIGHDQADYLNKIYETLSNKSDISVPFLELAESLSSGQGMGGYISTSQWLSTDYGESARSHFARGSISKIVDFGTQPVFKGISTYPAIFLLSNNSGELDYLDMSDSDTLTYDAIREEESRAIPYSRFDEDAWVFEGLDLRELLTAKPQTVPISEFGGFKIGALTGLDEVFVVSSDEVENRQLESGILYPYIYRGGEVSRFKTVEPDKYVIYPYLSGDDGAGELIDPGTLKNQYPNIYQYLQGHHDQLSERQDSREYYAQGDDWYRFLREGRYEYLPPKKLIFKGIATESTVGIAPENTIFSGANCPGFVPDDESVVKYIWSILNSSLISEYLTQVCPAKMQGYTRFNANNLNEAPIVQPSYAKSMEPEISESGLANGLLSTSENGNSFNLLEQAAENMNNLVNTKSSLNLSLRDHLGSYTDGQTLADIGLTQPPKGSADSTLQQTTEQKPNLRVGEASVERESPNTVEIRLTARYKPDDEDAHETDQWGYTETEPLPALRITDLTETEADLVAAFVPIAVDEAGGFADFRETATKTNSLVDRLRKLTLPAVDDVREGLESYTETVERAEELEAKIKRTDDLIDEIVYELYGLTDEEIEIVEETVAD